MNIQHLKSKISLKNLVKNTLLSLTLSCATLPINAFAVIDDTKTETASHDFTSVSSIASWLLSTILILGIIMVIAYLLKKTKFIKTGGNDLGTLNQIYLGPKQRVVLVKAYDKHILLGVTQNSITYLTEVNPNKDTSLKVEEISEIKPNSNQDIEKSKATFDKAYNQVKDESSDKSEAH